MTSEQDTKRSTIVKKTLTWALALALSGALVQAWAQNSKGPLAKRAAHLAATVCFACHGPGGVNTDPQFPNLAAQTPTYIENQLHHFRSHYRAEPTAQHFMWGVASRDIDSELITAIAHYYASQPPAKGIPGNANLVTEGYALFHKGDPTQGLPACASCHGANAQGNGPFPRLAGQHRAYIVKQLHFIKDAIRKAPVMHGIAIKLNSQQMEAVATYLQSLN